MHLLHRYFFGRCPKRGFSFVYIVKENREVYSYGTTRKAPAAMTTSAAVWRAGWGSQTACNNSQKKADIYRYPCDKTQPRHSIYSLLKYNGKAIAPRFALSHSPLIFANRSLRSLLYSYHPTCPMPMSFCKQTCSVHCRSAGFSLFRSL